MMGRKCSFKDAVGLAAETRAAPSGEAQAAGDLEQLAGLDTPRSVDEPLAAASPNSPAPAAGKAEDGRGTAEAAAAGGARDEQGAAAPRSIARAPAGGAAAPA
ncbi:unnamed protein product [Prorocentrum cordatum]|uniref:Uncharacterized protein n=1 Tax=Prorocentrum cordatum TaxID=2364126 RepID=A0ABN9XAS5_9DINO|nr:unnamed protein product [Polarella glacialis]